MAEVTSVPSPMRLVSRASAPRGDPGPGRAWPWVAGAHPHEVVGAEERVEAGVLRGPGDAEQVVVRRPLLGLGEHAEIHAAHLGIPDQAGQRRRQVTTV